MPTSEFESYAPVLLAEGWSSTRDLLDLLLRTAAPFQLAGRVQMSTTTFSGWPFRGNACNSTGLLMHKLHLNFRPNSLPKAVQYLNLPYL